MYFIEFVIASLLHSQHSFVKRHNPVVAVADASCPIHLPIDRQENSVSSSAEAIEEEEDYIL